MRRGGERRWHTCLRSCCGRCRNGRRVIYVQGRSEKGGDSSTTLDRTGCSNAITSALPLPIAHRSGIRWYISGLSGLTSSCLSSIFTIPSCPFRAALKSGVLQYLSSLSGLASFCPSSISATPPCPFVAAHTRGVLPVQFCSISQSSTPTKPATTSMALKKDAQWRPLD